MRVLHGFLFVLACGLSCRAQELPVGKVIAKVVCELDESKSYALYVPSSYVREKAWPVIFCFDPSARGNLPVERLQAAAEKYGYIVAGSHDSRNGPFPGNAPAIQAMIKDVSAHLSVDSKRIYTAGMSGGSRVAITIAMSGFAKGVIACGAGFPVPVENIPPEVRFAFFGIVGTEDFNLPELRQTDDALRDRGASHRLVTFNGPHVWPPEEKFMEAVEWLEVESMRAGTRAKDDAFVQRLFAARKAALAELPELERWRELRSIAADYGDFLDTTEFKKEADALAASRAFKKALKEERAMAGREIQLTQQLTQLAGSGWMEQQQFAGKIRERAAAVSDSPDRRMARRAIAGYVVMTREAVGALFKENDYAAAAAALELAVALRPDHARNWYDLARARVYTADKRSVFDALERAAAIGFDDVVHAEAEPRFEKLKADPRFEKFLEAIRLNRTDEVMQLPAMHISAVLANVELRPFFLGTSGDDARKISFLRVDRVRAGTAAARAGVEAGQEVTIIQDVRVRGLTESELEEAMQTPVKGEIVMSLRAPFQRDEKIVRVPVRKTAE